MKADRSSYIKLRYTLVYALMLFAGIVTIITSYRTIDIIDKGHPGFCLLTKGRVSFFLGKNWTGFKDGLKTLDLIHSYDGIPFTSAHQFKKYIQTKKPGTKITYNITRENQKKTLTVHVMAMPANLAFYHFINIIAGGILLMVCGFIVFFVRPNHQLSLLFFLALYTTGLFLVLNVDYLLSSVFLLPVAVTTQLHYILNLHVTLLIYDRFWKPDRFFRFLKKRFIWFLYVINTALALVYAYFFHHERTEEFISHFTIGYLLTIVNGLSTYGLCLYAYVKTRKKAPTSHHIALISLHLGSFPFFVYMFFSGVFKIALPPELIFTLMLSPFVGGFLLLYRNAFHLNIVPRRKTLYWIFGFAFAFLFLLDFILFKPILIRYNASDVLITSFLITSGILKIMIIFWVQYSRLIDRLFFPSTYNFQKMIYQASHEFGFHLTPNAILQKAKLLIDQNLQINPCVFYLKNQAGTFEKVNLDLDVNSDVDSDSDLKSNQKEKKETKQKQNSQNSLEESSLNYQLSKLPQNIYQSPRPKPEFIMSGRRSALTENQDSLTQINADLEDISNLVSSFSSSLSSSSSSSANPPANNYWFQLLEQTGLGLWMILSFHQQVVGFVFLGFKKSNTPYLQEDLENLRSLLAIVSVSLVNNESYHTVLDLKDQLELENESLKQELLNKKGQNDTIIGKNGGLKPIFDQIARLKQSLTTILLMGESGTGKELIAKTIHDQSIRKNQVFLKVNCAAIPAHLLESEFFGYEAGAFTDARKSRKGLFEASDGGTLFLDEIGELPLELQSKLLRALQEQEVKRLGSLKPIKVDVRIIAATNRNLEEDVKNQKFRADLYYRLAVLPIRLPALRDRKEDIEALVEYFVEKYEKKMQKYPQKLTKKQVQELKSYSWPGNVRELENTIERSIALSQTGKPFKIEWQQKVTITQDSVTQDSVDGNNRNDGNHRNNGGFPEIALELEINSTDSITQNLDKQLENYKKQLIIQAITKTKGNKAQAARNLGFQPSSFYRLLKQLGLKE